LGCKRTIYQNKKGVMVMNLTITGKELKATEAIKEYVEKKLTRIEKYFGDSDIDVNVTIKTEKTAQVADIYVSVNGNTYKAGADEKDLYASIDKDIDILEGQIRKMKAKREKMQRDASIKQMAFEGTESKLVEDEVVKVVHYDIRPISIEDAQVKLAENNSMLFLPFVNSETGTVNVIYKKDNNYGIVEPEA
jgi:putative sigma-54 modulation protein